MCDEGDEVEPGTEVELIPMYCDNSWGYSGKALSDGYVLVRIDTGRLSIPEGYWTTIKHRGELITAVGMYVGEYTVWYTALYMINAGCRQLAKQVGSCLVGNYRVSYSDADNDVYSRLRYKRPVTGYTIRHGMWQTQAITQNHHTHIRPSDVIWCVVQSKNAENFRKHLSDHITLPPTGVTEKLAALLHELERLNVCVESSVATMMLYVSVAKQEAVEAFIYFLQQASDYADMRRILKVEGQLAKQQQGLYRHDLAQLFELNVLINRQDGDVDWDTEIEHRTKPVCVGIGADRVYKLACEIFDHSHMAGARPRATEWATYWAARWAHSPSGSFVSQYDEDKEVKKLFPATQATKKSVLSHMANTTHRRWLNRKPELYASTSVKYEWDKVRALYGCDVTSYIHADYGMGDCDDMLPHYFPVGQRAEAKLVRSNVLKMQQSIPLCYDYDDFNAQHSLSSMAAVVQAYNDTFGNYLTAEQRESNSWTIKAIRNQKFRVNQRGGITLRAAGTLFSGWRLTSFVNCVLNRVYLVEAGLRKFTTYALHNGDDVLASVETLGHGLALIESAADLGIRAQKSKMNIGTIGEFLRVDGMATDPTGSQYLTRACATATHSRIDSAVPNDLLGYINSNIDRMTGLKDRGGDVSICERLGVILNDWAARLFEVNKTVIKAVYDHHPVQGGINTEAPLRETRVVTLAGGADEDGVAKTVELMDRGMQDYVNLLASELDMDVSDVNREIIRNAARKMTRGCKMTRAVAKDDRPDRHAMRVLYRAHTAHPGGVSIDKARLVGLTDLLDKYIPYSVIRQTLRGIVNKHEFLTAII